MYVDAQNRFPHAAYMDPTARVYGEVEIGENASLWPYVVIRAENRHVRIGQCLSRTCQQLTVQCVISPLCHQSA